eukprot:scaffold12192_cov20-Tisochrysis_lutea.AAC.5
MTRVRNAGVRRCCPQIVLPACCRVQLPPLQSDPITQSLFDRRSCVQHNMYVDVPMQGSGGAVCRPCQL